MADYYDAGKFGAVLAVPFSVTNATTGAANEDAKLAGGGTLVVMPKAGSVVGVSIRAAGAITAGTITAKPHKASTEYAEVGTPAPVVSSAAQGSYASVAPGALRFSAGDTVGISVTTTTTLDPTNTLDVDGLLFVQLDAS
jgi:hypothetical protein